MRFLISALRSQLLLTLVVLNLLTVCTTAPVLGFRRPVTNPADSSAVQKGQELFQTYCSTCHNFLQKGIGPSLERTLTATSANWLKQFIHNAPEMIKRGDERANRLYREYKQMMPAFTSLQEPELDALVAYIGANQRKGTAKKRVGPDGIANPIATNIPISSLTLELEHVMTAPVSASAAPLARINKMWVLPGQKERMFIVDLRGKLYEVEENDWRVVMDMQKVRPDFIHTPGLGTGFGSFAFHPEFYRNGLLYTTHTEKPHTAPADFAYADSIKVTLQWVLTEWKLNDPQAAVFSGSGRELLRIDMVSPIHGVQEITFNPLAKPGSADYGLLYIGVGDGGSSENGYPFLCDSKKRPWGAVLRIDPAGRNSKNGRYGIPASNPFAGEKGTAVAREIFCRGFRNPNRIVWTPDGKMLISDIGHANIEELNIGIAGAEYGWPNREGTFVINPRGRMDQVYALPANDATLRYTYPALQYDHDEGKAIAGGYVYTGSSTDPLTGKYIFSDIANGRVFFAESARLSPGKPAPIQELPLRIDGQPTTFQALNGTAKPDVRIGLGAKGQIYIMTKADGKIYRVKGAKPSP